MGFLNEFFDEIYCINLDRRTDRWEEVQAELSKWNIHAKRISAVDGETLAPHPDQIISANEMGCVKSHLSILEEMSRKKYDKVLILEDDILFIRDPHKQTKIISEYLPDKWDMLYLGGNQVKPLIKQGSIWKCTRTFTTCAYGITREFGEHILATIRPHSRQIDVVYANTHPRGNSFSISPGCCTQKAGFSDIQNAHVDYTKFL